MRNCYRKPHWHEQRHISDWIIFPGFAREKLPPSLTSVYGSFILMAQANNFSLYSHSMGNIQ